jgi:hypothetical protein
MEDLSKSVLFRAWTKFEASDCDDLIYYRTRIAQIQMIFETGVRKGSTR